jgi:DNA-directed RNA polymerase specialized sigma24 family protein
MGTHADETVRDVDYSTFVRLGGSRLLRVLVAHYGVDVGSDAAADALRYGWEHWDRVAQMENPIGYLYRVAQSSVRRQRRWRRELPFPARDATYVDSSVDSELFDVLARLSPLQRVSVLLVHAYDWTYPEVADVLGIKVSAVTNHVHRGTSKLRRLLDDDA